MFVLVLDNISNFPSLNLEYFITVILLLECNWLAFVICEYNLNYWDEMRGSSTSV